MSYAVLVVCADAANGRHLARQLQVDGYRPELGRSIDHARALAEQRPPSLAIVGDLDGPRGALELVDEIRADDTALPWDPGLPTLVLSARAEELDLLRAFEAGADDFMAFPVSYLELRARVGALLRRSRSAAGRRRMRVRSLEVDPMSRVVTLAGRPVDLSRREFELLVLLAGDPARVFTKEELLHELWGFRGSGSTRTLESHASRLRRKLGGLDGGWIVNVWGVGYRLGPTAGDVHPRVVELT